MPNGRVHFELWKKGSRLAVAGSLPVAAMAQKWYYAPLTLVGYGLGAIIDPDLDMIQLTQAERRIIKKFGWFGYLWIAYWIPYAGFCKLYAKGHRGWLSHSYVLSTIVRLAYVGWPWVYFGIKYLGLPMVLNLCIPIFLGLTYSDAIHIRADFAQGD